MRSLNCEKDVMEMLTSAELHADSWFALIFSARVQSVSRKVLYLFWELIVSISNCPTLAKQLWRCPCVRWVRRNVLYFYL
jgi:hypothetical protein